MARAALQFLALPLPDHYEQRGTPGREGFAELFHKGVVDPDIPERAGKRPGAGARDRAEGSMPNIIPREAPDRHTRGDQRERLMQAHLPLGIPRRHHRITDLDDTLLFQIGEQIAQGEGTVLVREPEHDEAAGFRRFQRRERIGVGIGVGIGLEDSSHAARRLPTAQAIASSSA
jgi:hypothetical protein